MAPVGTVSRLGCWLVVPVLILVLAGPACAAPPAYRTASVDHGSLKKVDGVWVMVLDGSPEQRGTAAGVLVGEQIRWLLPRYMRASLGVARVPASRVAQLRKLAGGLSPAHTAQLEALARSARVDFGSLLAANLATELSSMGCSCLITHESRSPDRTVRLARNLDWPGGALLVGLGLVVVEGGPGQPHRFASITWPGLVGAVTGINDAGLAVADLMAYPKGGLRLRPGVPVLFAVRTMLERAASVDAAQALLEVMERTMPQNYALADPGGGRTMETGPDTFRVRPDRSGLAGITNYYDEDRQGRTDGRYAKMFTAAGEGKLDRSRLKQILEQVALGDLNVQAVVLEPAGRVVHLANTDRPAAGGPWTRLDLSPWLKKDPPTE